MTDDVELVLSGDSISQGDDLVGGEFDDVPAALADHVIVRRLAEDLLVVGLFRLEAHLFENTAFDQQMERAVDGGFAYVVLMFVEETQQLLSLEMCAQGENGVQDQSASARVLDGVVSQVLAKRRSHIVVRAR